MFNASGPIGVYIYIENAKHHVMAECGRLRQSEAAILDLNVENTLHVYPNATKKTNNNFAGPLGGIAAGNQEVLDARRTGIPIRSGEDLFSGIKGTAKGPVELNDFFMKCAQSSNPELAKEASRVIQEVRGSDDVKSRYSGFGADSASARQKRLEKQEERSSFRCMMLSKHAMKKGRIYRFKNPDDPSMWLPGSPYARGKDVEWRYIVPGSLLSEALGLELEEMTETLYIFENPGNWWQRKNHPWQEDPGANIFKRIPPWDLWKLYLSLGVTLGAFLIGSLLYIFITTRKTANPEEDEEEAASLSASAARGQL